MMKVRLVAALMVALLALPALASDLAGAWKGSITSPMGTHPIGLNIKIEGGTVTGTMTGGPPAGGEQQIVNGKLQGDQLSFDVKAKGPGGDEMLLAYKGKIQGNRIEGSHESPMGSMPWEATKQ